MRYRGSGWWGESHRHSLAARGIKTGNFAQQRQLYAAAVVATAAKKTAKRAARKVVKKKVKEEVKEKVAERIVKGLPKSRVVGLSRAEQINLAAKEKARKVGSEMWKTLKAGFAPLPPVDEAHLSIDERKQRMKDIAIARKEVGEELRRHDKILPVMPDMHAELPPLPEPKKRPLTEQERKAAIKKKLREKERLKKLRAEAEDEIYWEQRPKSLTDPNKPLPSLMAKGIPAKKMLTGHEQHRSTYVTPRGQTWGYTGKHPSHFDNPKYWKKL